MAHNAKSPTPEAIRAVIEPIIESADLFCEEVTVSGPPNRMVLRVILDLPEDELGGLSLERVAQVSRPISDALDASDLFKGAYNLEVSSPGATRPLTEERHFKRARTRLVRMTLRDGGTVTGRVREVEAGDVIYEDASGSDQRVPLEAVKEGVVEVELRRMADVDLEPVGDDEGEEG